MEAAGTNPEAGKGLQQITLKITGFPIIRIAFLMGLKEGAKCNIYFRIVSYALQPVVKSLLIKTDFHC